ncbi:DNA internalization-related competence protein ComEC/Rec2 [Microbulbifer aggregans]|nr:DNA internalization-related competence protein ComEC/Rec2 [Microbulbifer aggregans]
MGYIPGLGALAAYIFGILSCGSLPELPDLARLAALGVLTVVLAAALPWRRRLVPLALAGLAGGLLVSWQGHHALENRLPEHAHGSDFTLPVRIDSLPAVSESRGRFGQGAGVDIRFSAKILPTAEPAHLRNQRVELTWYRAAPDVVKRLKGGSVWSLPVRLKQPRGSVNPHGFDYEGWLLRRGIYATGYVRPQDAMPRVIGGTPGLTAVRQWFRDGLSSTGLGQSELILALVLGDRSALSREDRQRLRDTGTAHLIAISGLHVGMVAAPAALLASLLARLVGLWLGYAPRLLVPGLSLLAATSYVLLAGAPLSAQRALVMLLVFFLAWYWRRRFHAGLGFGLALALVLTLQPLAFHGPGFWLSFLAVGALLIGFRGRYWLPKPRSTPAPDSPVAQIRHRLSERLRDLLRSQWLIGVVLVLPSLAFFHGFSISGFVFNLVAIPWMAIGILPLLLVGTLSLGTSFGQYLLSLANTQLEALMAMLGNPLFGGGAWLSGGLSGSGWLFALYALGILWVLLPAGVPGRGLGWIVPAVLLATMAGQWIPRSPAVPVLETTVLDVGQGLAVVLRNNDQALVYDTGPGSGEGWSAGGQIVAPFLLGEGYRQVDLLVLSHGDSDHAGGLSGLTESLPVKALVAPGRLAAREAATLDGGVSRCLAGQVGRIGNMRIEWLWPDSSDVSGEENDHSCVALVEWEERRILLTGDISRSVERQLALRYPDFAPVDLLVAPHHGSRSSSSEALLDWGQPQVVVFSAGYRHHFGHPHVEVVERYQRHGSRIFSTAERGAVTIQWSSGAAEPRILSARDKGPFWVRH